MNVPTTLGEIVYKAAGVVNQVEDTVSGQVRNVFQLLKHVIAPSAQRQLLQSANSSAGSSPSSIATNLTIPSTAAVLTFDFRFSQPGNGDWVTVLFNDTLLFSFLGISFIGNDYQHIQIPVGNLAGQTGVLTVVLNEAGSQDAEVLVSNFQFLSNDPITHTVAVKRDFNGDGTADILWRHISGAIALWLMNGTAITGGGSVGSVSPDWIIAGVGDVNGDGKADILWRHTSGALALWLMNGTTISGGGSLGSVPTDWQIP